MIEINLSKYTGIHIRIFIRKPQWMQQPIHHWRFRNVELEYYKPENVRRREIERMSLDELEVLMRRL